MFEFGEIVALVFSALDVFVRMGCEFSNNMHFIPSMMIYSAIWMCIAGRTSCLFVNRPLLHPFVVVLKFMFGKIKWISGMENGFWKSKICYSYIQHLGDIYENFVLS